MAEDRSAVKQKILHCFYFYTCSVEAKASIPRLTLKDIEPKTLELPITVEKNGRVDKSGITILSHDVPSNGILYMDTALDFSGVNLDDLPYLQLFSR
jgi:hypothetical protein